MNYETIIKNNKTVSNCEEDKEYIHYGDTDSEKIIRFLDKMGNHRIFMKTPEPKKNGVSGLEKEFREELHASSRSIYNRLMNRLTSRDKSDLPSFIDPSRLTDNSESDLTVAEYLALVYDDFYHDDSSIGITSEEKLGDIVTAFVNTIFRHGCISSLGRMKKTADPKPSNSTVSNQSEMDEITQWENHPTCKRLPALLLNYDAFIRETTRIPEGYEMDELGKRGYRTVDDLMKECACYEEAERDVKDGVASENTFLEALDLAQYKVNQRLFDYDLVLDAVLLICSEIIRYSWDMYSESLTDYSNNMTSLYLCLYGYFIAPLTEYFYRRITQR